ncbi:hypothetical protein B0T17DRAFT_603314 [Bombardia bombarda]|uniref:Uncharacterized protein n=1 Tax=Bombardia bombarda TaxID=252184 RepID=A0AA39TMP2_9PEZI|nr:hypothetical protein B0T17DRAFT_603314 [Bombardia bombarda]
MPLKDWFSRLHFPTRPASEPAKASSTSTVPSIAPDADMLAKIYAVGDSTIEDTFRNELAIISSPDGELLSTPNLSLLPSKGKRSANLFLTALSMISPHSIIEPHCIPPWTALIPVLTRCITDSSFDTIQHADAYMKSVSGISAFEDPQIGQLLVAVALRHRNLTLLQPLSAATQPPKPNIFYDPHPGNLLDTLDDQIYAAKAKAILQTSGWIKPEPVSDPPSPPPPPPTEPAHPPSPDAGFDLLSRSLTHPQEASPTAALAALESLTNSNWDPQYATGRTLDLLVIHGTGLMLLRFLPLVSRTLYDGISLAPPYLARLRLARPQGRSAG